MSTVIVNGTVGSESYTLSNASQPTTTFNYTVPAGTNCLVVTESSGAYDGSQSAPSSITYNGVALTMVSGSSVTVGSVESSIWYLLTPPTAVSYVLAATYASSVDAGALGAIPLANVNTGAPVGTATTANGSTSTSAVTASGGGSSDLYIGTQASGYNGTTVTPGGGQTNLYTQPSRGGWGLSGDSIAGGGSGAFTWTQNGAPQWAASAVAFKAVGAPSVVNPTFMQNQFWL